MSGSVCNCTDILADVSDGSSGDSDYDDDSTNLVNDLHKISPVPMPLVLGRSIGVTVAGLSNSVSSVLMMLNNKTDRLCFIAYFLIY